MVKYNIEIQIKPWEIPGLNSFTMSKQAVKNFSVLATY
jgi:hypothetical protein